jgi:hypothetical protein
MNSGLFSGLSLNDSVYIGIGMRAETVPAVKIAIVRIRHNPIDALVRVFIYFPPNFSLHHIRILRI